MTKWTEVLIQMDLPLPPKPTFEEDKLIADIPQCRQRLLEAAKHHVCISHFITSQQLGHISYEQALMGIIFTLLKTQEDLSHAYLQAIARAPFFRVEPETFPTGDDRAQINFPKPVDYEQVRGNIDGLV